MKLWRDFGVTALFGTLVIAGSFVLIGIGVTRGQIDYDVLLPVIGGWVGAIIGAYFTLKARKS